MIAQAGASQADLARVLNKTPAVVTNLFNGVRELKVPEAVRISEWLKRPVAEIMGGNKIPVQAYVGEGGEVFPYSEAEKLPESRTSECPPGLDPTHVFAIRIKGEAMLPVLQPDWIVYYSDRRDIIIPVIRDGWQVPYNPLTEERLSEFFDKMCVVKLKDGRTMLRTLERGYTPGRYNLTAFNSAKLADMEIDWAAKIIFIKTA